MKRVTNPGKMKAVLLLCLHCEALAVPYAKPYGMSCALAVDPDWPRWTGVYFQAQAIWEAVIA